MHRHSFLLSTSFHFSQAAMDSSHASEDEIEWTQDTEEMSKTEYNSHVSETDMSGSEDIEAEVRGRRNDIFIQISDSSDSDDMTPVKIQKVTGGGKKPTLKRSRAKVIEETVDEEISWPTSIATSKSQKRMRNFVWTLNNYTAEDVKRMKDFGEACTYHCFGMEIAASGTPHLQGCTLLGKQVSFSVLKKLPYPFGKCAMYPMKGTPQQASDYCKKEGKFFEYGECPKSKTPGKSGRPGARNDLVKVVQRVKEGASDAQLLEEHPVETFRFLRNIQHVRALVKPVRKNPLKVILCYGTPGCGKTHWAHDKYPDIYRLPTGKDFWMDNYMRQPEVLFDDFNGNVSLTNLLQILDHYVIQVPIKGGFVWWCPEVIVLTCNTHPCNWYDYSKRQDSYSALLRRITQVLKFQEPLEIAGERTYIPPAEAEVRNFFLYQKVLGKFCDDISENIANIRPAQTFDD